MDKQWFVCDPDNNIYEFFETEEDAVSYAQDCVNACLDEEWSDGVESIFVSKITHRTVVINSRPDPDGRFDALCDYEIQKIKYMKNIEVLKTEISKIIAAGALGEEERYRFEDNGMRYIRWIMIENDIFKKIDEMCENK